jgi:hypothetical protein
VGLIESFSCKVNFLSRSILLRCSTIFSRFAPTERICLTVTSSIPFTRTGALHNRSIRPDVIDLPIRAKE